MKRTDIPAMKLLAHRRGTFGMHHPVIVLDNTQLWCQRYAPVRGTYRPAPTQKRCRLNVSGRTENRYGILALSAYGPPEKSIQQLTEAADSIHAKGITSENVAELDEKLPVRIQVSLLNNSRISGDWHTVHAQELEEERKADKEWKESLSKQNANRQYRRKLYDHLSQTYDTTVTGENDSIHLPLDVVGDLLNIPRDEITPDEERVIKL